MKRKNEDDSQQTIQTSFNSKSYLSENSARSIIITQKISEIIALDYQLFFIVEDRGFKNLMNVLESRYKLPIRKILSFYFNSSVVLKKII